MANNSVVVEIKNIEECRFEKWEFEIDQDNYIQVSLDNMVMDTIEDLGKINSLIELQEKVNYLIKCWDVETK